MPLPPLPPGVAEEESKPEEEPKPAVEPESEATTSEPEAVQSSDDAPPPLPPSPPPKEEEESLTFVETWLRIPEDAVGKEIEEDIVSELVRRHEAWIADA